ncbi:4'-phosphopantetheinyl transferase family protein [Chromobacterium sphagni]|uniref:4'-phosphopantetheinyl transferase domain-containing protein n=1 Tax=Chromobacterium sphagni TaxID=1903179 RepID=A0ABX3CDG9_9NEIS|nr:4'-phosphopantetheinyl transferase superfamily protein [Chromobacterium sphagni]OHX20343.1 hypothetical protein BI344_07600 [Chromobacterium sphagni]
MMVEDIQVWLTPLARCHDPFLLEAYAALLSGEERVRWRAFVFERDRHAYLVTRALARTVLGERLGVDPARLDFQRGPYGKPSLGGSAAGAGLSFNLSHTDGMVVLSVAAGRELGVDVESVMRPPALDIAWDNFSSEEARELSALEGSARADHFWMLWTLKEAYLKALGCGLNAPLDCISFSARSPGEIVYARQRSGDADARRWHFWHWAPSASHAASLCVESTAAAPPGLILREALPLARAVQLPFAPAVQSIRERASSLAWPGAG